MYVLQSSHRQQSTTYIYFSGISIRYPITILAQADIQWQGTRESFLTFPYTYFIPTLGPAGLTQQLPKGH